MHLLTPAWTLPTCIVTAAPRSQVPKWFILGIWACSLSLMSCHTGGRDRTVGTLGIHSLACSGFCDRSSRLCPPPLAAYACSQPPLSQNPLKHPGPGMGSTALPGDSAATSGLPVRHMAGLTPVKPRANSTD